MSKIIDDLQIAFHMGLPVQFVSVGDHLCRQGRFSEAREMYERAIGLLQSQDWSQPDEIVPPLLFAASACYSSRLLGEGDGHTNRAYRIIREALGESAGARLMHNRLYNLWIEKLAGENRQHITGSNGDTYCRHSRYDFARREYEAELDASMGQPGFDFLAHAVLLFKLADVCRMLKSDGHADAYERQALHVLRQEITGDYPDYSVVSLASHRAENECRFYVCIQLNARVRELRERPGL